ncbi:hypothetical protein K2173_023339 [Erythroxylum novogranatense]|uniref:DNA-(apurinic or apyrimidinic site) endonuclease n=1 Tax=Erythroxylum novogranatense TaxID=1862640 RepID=A0AAV8TYP1_9ROSI|nr:hypothetical protein K2173_023339 [Erythroxylum novogranatense]
MKIVTYNVNGLRQRISQFGSLVKLLDSFDADIICFQETKLRRQELTADLVVADGYESFFSCTRTSDRGRTGYSGVATFCRVKSAYSSNEVALPVAAEEGFTGLVNHCKGEKDIVAGIVNGLEEFERDELLKIDSEGRCVFTDHHHFVLFNLYGPRAESDDTERIEFKLKFFKILQKRWEYMLQKGRRIFVVGDLNIAPTSMDRCDAGPDFENNEFRRWFRSMLVEYGGKFSDCFRSRHPKRTGAFTCWPSNTGAEQFNYGTRIDHILCAGACLHQELELQRHNFLTCHIKDCDILTEYKRWKPGNTSWKGGWSMKLEGSDHAPVFVHLMEIPNIQQHNVPSLSARYLPMIRGFQQTLVSLLTKRQSSTQVESNNISSSLAEGGVNLTKCSESVKRSFDDCMVSELSTSCLCSCDEHSNSSIWKADENPKDFSDKVCAEPKILSQSGQINSYSTGRTKKRAKKSQSFQLSLKSYFQKIPACGIDPEKSSNYSSISRDDLPNSNNQLSGIPAVDDQNSSLKHDDPNSSVATQDQDEVNGSSLGKEKNDIALQEWQRIQLIMQNSVPLCKGHGEPCVARIVKKPGPTFGHRFYVCARAEGPASNREANCGYFKWASSKARQK